MSAAMNETCVAPVASAHWRAVSTIVALLSTWLKVHLRERDGARRVCGSAVGSSRREDLDWDDKSVQAGPIGSIRICNTIMGY